MSFLVILLEQTGHVEISEQLLLCLKLTHCCGIGADQDFVFHTFIPPSPSRV